MNVLYMNIKEQNCLDEKGNEEIEKNMEEDGKE